MLKAWRDRDKLRDKANIQTLTAPSRPSNVNSRIQGTPSPRKPPDKPLYNFYEHEREQDLVETEPKTVIKQVQKDLAKFGRNYDGYYEAYDNTRALLNAHLNTVERTLRFGKETMTPSIYHEMILCSARLHEGLGTYEEIENHFKNIFPSLKLEGGIITGLESLQERFPGDQALPSSPDRFYLRLLIDLMGLLTRVGRMLEFVDAMTRTLPLLSEFAPEERFAILRASIQTLNRRSKFSEAANQISVWEYLFPSAKTPEYSPMLLEVAINKAGLKSVTGKTEQEKMELAQRAFILALVSSAIVCGPWHYSTLEVLHYFGKALREWNLQKAAAVLQEECYLGSIYRFGAVHPRSREVLTELHRCKVSQSHLYDLKLFGQRNFDREKKLSIVYEHIHLNTVIDLLQRIAETVKISYVDIKYIAQWHGNSKDLHPSGVNRAARVAANCIFQLGDVQTVNKFMDNKTWKPFGWESPAPLVELVKYSANPQQSSKTVLQSCLRDDFGKDHEREAVYRRLTADGHMHFTRDVIAEQPPLISEQDSEAVGTGAFAVVDSVKIEGKLYARKSVMLPRFHQKGIRKIIQNEVSIVQALDHPHIVRLFLTYEDKFRFYIVMKPLADYDLEAYLQEHMRKPPTQHQRDMVWKWMLCLSNTMAYIHFKGIRHKDIKPRNVLIKGTDVVFADFGSSHTFLEEGNSTTEGPAFGHTKLYCAPEVLASGKRGRMSDIFSLGCVFTELAVWLSGSTLESWNQQRKVDIGGVSNHTYSATLMRITRMMGLTQNDREVCGLYEGVIKPMLREEPKQRPTAVQISERVISSYHHVYGRSEGFQQCPKCYLERWVDVANARSASVMSLDASMSTMEEED